MALSRAILCGFGIWFFQSEALPTTSIDSTTSISPTKALATTTTIDSNTSISPTNTTYADTSYADNSSCPVNCFCDDDDVCVGCPIWYVHRWEAGNGDCEFHIKDIQFPKKPKLLQHNVEKNAIQVKLEMLDLNLPEDALDYYGYSLQYKTSSMTDAPFENTGQFIHHYPSEDWLYLRAVGLLPNTFYTFRAALYRWFKLKGMLELLDVSDPITVKTLDPSWRWYGGNEYMFSSINNIQPMNFATAANLCKHNGGELTKVSSVFETEFISNYNGSSNTWIGLHLPDDVDTNGSDSCGSCYSSDNKSISIDCTLCHHCRSQWRWTDGSEVQYTFWNVQEPNQKFRCAYLQNKVWYSANCSTNLDFCCRRGSTETAPLAPSLLDQTSARSDSPSVEIARKIDAVIGIVSSLAVVVIIAVIAVFWILKRNNHAVSTSTDAQQRQSLELGTIKPENIHDVSTSTDAQQRQSLELGTIKPENIHDVSTSTDAQQRQSLEQGTIKPENIHDVSTSTYARQSLPLERGPIIPEVDVTQYKTFDSNIYENHPKKSQHISVERMDENEQETYLTLVPGPVEKSSVYAAVNNERK